MNQYDIEFVLDNGFVKSIILKSSVKTAIGLADSIDTIIQTGDMLRLEDIDKKEHVIYTKHIVGYSVELREII
jgi:hypothetical protein